MADKEKIKERENQILELATSFCAQHLDEEYFKLTEKVVKKLCRKRPSPLATGKIEIWAASVVHALGSTNFLFDKSFEPYVSADEINEYFGTKKSTVINKASSIKRMFKMDYFNNEFLTQRIIEGNPLNNMVMVDGLIVPLDSIPEEYQQMVREARAKGEDISFWTNK